MSIPEDLIHPEPFTILDEIDVQDVALLDERLYEFNVASTGITDGRLLAIILRDDRGEIMAGLYGWTWGRCCEIKTLWIHQDQRGKGLGTRLLNAAEAEARTRGAVQIVLSTHSFQAPDFYRRFGYEVVGSYDDYPEGYQQYFLRKRLSPQ